MFVKVLVSSPLGKRPEGNGLLAHMLHGSCNCISACELPKNCGVQQCSEGLEGPRLYAVLMQDHNSHHEYTVSTRFQAIGVALSTTHSS